MKTLLAAVLLVVLLVAVLPAGAPTPPILQPGRFQLISARVATTIEKGGKTGTIEQTELFRLDTATGETAHLSTTASAGEGIIRMWITIEGPISAAALRQHDRTNTPPR